MKVGLIVLCRYNSSRLPGKILKQIAQKPLLDYILERLNLVKNADQVVVATSDESTDDPIAAHCLKMGIPCFRGSLDNVAARFYHCAEHFRFDYAVRINGDNLFTDHELIDEMINTAVANRYNFVSNVKGRTYPTGMSIEIVKTGFYKKMLPLFDSDAYKEHVTLYFYEHPDQVSDAYHQVNDEVPAAKGMKLAVDSEEDFTFASQVISSMTGPHTGYKWSELIKLIRSIR